jgi:hypothetical protein
MKAILSWLTTLVVALSIGTAISLVIVLGMLWWKGAFGDERLLAMLAALQGIKALPPAQAKNGLDKDAEQPSLDQIMQTRLRAALDLDLRENAIDKSLGDLRTLELQIRTESKRLDLWKQDFDARLAKLETAATDAALLELQRTLEAMQPKQAKEQILKMLEEPVTTTDKPMQDIVTIMKAMPTDKRKKLLGEFKTPLEIEKLADVLRVIRRGTPDTDLLRDTRNQLQQQQNPQP